MENEGNKYIRARKEKIIAVGITILSLVVIIGVGYAFFSGGLSNANKEKFSTEIATISLKFADNDNGISGTLNLGESIIKKFTLQNTGTQDSYAKINWYNLVNTYTSDSLTWTLEQSTSENGTYEALGSGKVPTSSTQTTKQLKNGILVPVNTTYYYKLTITLNNLDANQNSDITANFHSYFNLEEGKLTGVDTIQNLVTGEPTNTTNVITKTAPEGSTCTNTFGYDGTVDNNLRYVGANPCNYVTFNNEFAGWRIVGVMNNVDDGTGNLETRIKLVRTEPLGYYMWDSTENDLYYGYGINDWTQADLMYELNGDYLDTTLTHNTLWYNECDNYREGQYDYTKGLKVEAQNQIGDTKWYLGGFTGNDFITASTLYERERGTTVWGSTSGQICNDSACPRATSWTGKVALLYISDHGFAVGGDIRETCLSYSVYSNSDCNENSWLTPFDCTWFINIHSEWQNAITYSCNGEGIVLDGGISDGVFPSVYLKSNVAISSGDGSRSNPYILK